MERESDIVSHGREHSYLDLGGDDYEETPEETPEAVSLEPSLSEVADLLALIPVFSVHRGGILFQPPSRVEFGEDERGIYFRAQGRIAEVAHPNPLDSARYRPDESDDRCWKCDRAPSTTGIGLCWPCFEQVRSEA